MTADKIVSLVARLKAKADEDGEAYASLDRVYKAYGILAKAIKRMRGVGLDDDQIVRVLRVAAAVLSGSE